MQKTYIIILVIVASLVILFVGYIGYTIYKTSKYLDVSNLTKGETKRTIDQTLLSLNYQHILSAKEEELYKNQLTENYNYFEQNGTGDADTFKKLILSAVNNLKDLMVNKEVVSSVSYFFRVANIEYGRKHPLDFAEKIVNEWVVKNLSFQDRLNMITKNVLSSTQSTDKEDKSKETIYKAVGEILLADIDKVKADSTMSSSQYKVLVSGSLEKFNQMELKPDNGENYSMVMLIPKIYHNISKLLGIDVTAQLIDWYNKQIVYTPPSFDELAENSRKYTHYMSDGGLINKVEEKKINTIVGNDIEAFKSSSDTVLLTRMAMASLKKLEQISGDTEDREFFATLYCDMAHNRGFSIGKEVNIWMYGVGDEEVEREMSNKLPWEY